MCGLAATQLRAGAARLFYGTTNYVLRAADLGGLYRSTDGSCRRAGPRGPGTTNVLRHRDYGPAATRRISYPAHIGTEPLMSRGLCHSTRLAPLPSGERARAAARWAGGLGSGLLPADQAEQRIWKDATFLEGVRMPPFESVSRLENGARIRTPRSNGLIRHIP